MPYVDLNESPRPRVLVLVPDDLQDRVVAAVTPLAGTLKVINTLNDVHTDEWDAIVTAARLGYRVTTTGGLRQVRTIPRHLQALVVQSELVNFTDYVETDKGAASFTLQSAMTNGKMAIIHPSLDDELASLVRSQLVPLIAQRSRQFGLSVEWRREKGDEYPGLKAFLVGPDAVMYAGKYLRTPTSSVWFIPQDLPNLAPWFEHAFRDWHELHPDTFPAAPNWLDDPTWYSQDEAEHAARVAAEAAEFDAVRRAHEEQLERLGGEFAALRQKSADGARQLLAGQGDPLQAAVLTALEALGFNVEDMDLIWDPRERREDYRITDPDEPGWMVIADATGSAKGVKGAKFLVVARYVTKYMGENPGANEPGYWVIANHFADRSPSSRPKDLTRGDELAALVETNGLVVDTVALFHLVRAVERDPGARSRIRATLRASRGQFTAADALALIGQPPTD